MAFTNPNEGALIKYEPPKYEFPPVATESPKHEPILISTSGCMSFGPYYYEYCQSPKTTEEAEQKFVNDHPYYMATSAFFRDNDKGSADELNLFITKDDPSNVYERCFVTNGITVIPKILKLTKKFLCLFNEKVQIICQANMESPFTLVILFYIDIKRCMLAHFPDRIYTNEKEEDDTNELLKKMMPSYFGIDTGTGPLKRN